ncbi:MAG: precorrin-6y C5,15-methyltransferase (decarboxylating) subunit CbiE [Rhodospirillaceae bacterium]
MTAWLTVVGIGEDGLGGLGARARAAVEGAGILVGGARHLAHILDDGRPRISWSGGLDAGIEAISRHAGNPVCVLASGDPLNFGIGKRLVARFGIDAMTILPAPGAFSLLAARMGWSIADGTVRCVSSHAFPVDVLNRHLLPGMRLLILSRNGETPAAAADLLVRRGFEMSPMTVFEHMGGDEEGRYDTVADEWEGRRVKDLNVIAVQCHPGPNAKIWPETPGLPEAAFRHDGKITKREVRAATIARLAAMPGQTLWDVGAGSGAVAIEWLRAAADTQAVAIESDPARFDDIEANARDLGVPHLHLVKGRAPAAFVDAREVSGGPPDAIFIGGGLSALGLGAGCFEALKPGGRLVANGVTLEAQEALTRLYRELGGEMTKISVARSDAVGSMTAMRPLMDVLQWSVTKP